MLNIAVSEVADADNPRQGPQHNARTPRKYFTPWHRR